MLGDSGLTGLGGAESTGAGGGEEGLKATVFHASSPFLVFHPLFTQVFSAWAVCAVSTETLAQKNVDSWLPTVCDWANSPEGPSSRAII